MDPLFSFFLEGDHRQRVNTSPDNWPITRERDRGFISFKETKQVVKSQAAGEGRPPWGGDLDKKLTATYRLVTVFPEGSRTCRGPKVGALGAVSTRCDCCACSCAWVAPLLGSTTLVRTSAQPAQRTAAPGGRRGSGRPAGAGRGRRWTGKGRRAFSGAGATSLKSRVSEGPFRMAQARARSERNVGLGAPRHLGDFGVS